jgi:hypothetical protein
VRYLRFFFVAFFLVFFLRAAMVGLLSRKLERTVSPVTRSVPNDLSRCFLAFRVSKASLRRLRAIATSQIDRERVRHERVKPAAHRASTRDTCVRTMLARVARAELRSFLSK